MTLSFSVLFLFFVFCFVFWFFFLLILSLSPPTYACVCVCECVGVRCRKFALLLLLQLVACSQQERLSPLCYRATTIGSAIRFCATGSTKKLVNRCRVNAIQCNQIRLVKYSNMAIIADTQMQGGEGGGGGINYPQSNRFEGDRWIVSLIDSSNSFGEKVKCETVSVRFIYY